MSFMQLETFRGRYFECDTTAGIEFVPGNLVAKAPTLAELQQYCSGTIQQADDVTIRVGLLARMQAPGYLDATDWCAYDSIADARADLVEDEVDVDELLGID